MRIGNKNPVHSYFINDFKLPIHTSFNDLGIKCNDNMSFNTHINTICTKAHLIINRLFRFVITNDYRYMYSPQTLRATPQSLWYSLYTPLKV